MKKKLFCTILSVLLAFSLAWPAAAAGAENFQKSTLYTDGQFTDVSATDWFYGSVKLAYELGLVKGSSETTFDPEGNITVMESIVLACRLHSIYQNGTGEFAQGIPWYQVYVDYAAKNMDMQLPHHLDLMGVATRQDFAYILACSLPKKELKTINHIEPRDLPDYYKISELYNEEVLRLYRAGIITGSDESGTFSPNSTIRRCEVAAIVTRMADTTQRKIFTPDRYPEKIILPAAEIFISGKSIIDIGITGDEAEYITVEYDTYMVEVEWGDSNGETKPLTVTPLQNGQTELAFYLDVSPEEKQYLTVNISGLE